MSTTESSDSLPFLFTRASNVLCRRYDWVAGVWTTLPQYSESCSTSTLLLERACFDVERFSNRGLGTGSNPGLLCYLSFGRTRGRLWVCSQPAEFPSVLVFAKEACCLLLHSMYVCRRPRLIHTFTFRLHGSVGNSSSNPTGRIGGRSRR